MAADFFLGESLVGDGNEVIPKDKADDLCVHQGGDRPGPDPEAKSVSTRVHPECPPPIRS